MPVFLFIWASAALKRCQTNWEEFILHTVFEFISSLMMKVRYHHPSCMTPHFFKTANQGMLTISPSCPLATNSFILSLLFLFSITLSSKSDVIISISCIQYRCVSSFVIPFFLVSIPKIYSWQVYPQNRELFYKLPAGASCSLFETGGLTSCLAGTIKCNVEA